MSGPVMMDIKGFLPDEIEREMLLHPHVSGMILFSRNFESTAQLKVLTQEIRDLNPNLMIAVDHEGGRVQRFKEGFTPIPAMGNIGQLYEKDPDQAIGCAEAAGLVLAWELRRCGVQFSFAPVLELDYGRSAVIGNRAFHSSPEVVAILAAALCRGMRKGGGVGVGKHFPGHGYVSEDSHHALPIDERSVEQLFSADMIPFSRLVSEGLEGIMPAHVVYSSADTLPAGFSRFWISQILRGTLGFDGVVFSDDLSMQGAIVVAGTPVDRARAALEAGCDMILVCNDRDATASILEGIKDKWISDVSRQRIAQLSSLLGNMQPVSEVSYQQVLDLLHKTLS